MKKTILFAAFSLSTSMAFAGWTERVACVIEKGAVDSGAALLSGEVVTSITLNGNIGEYGKVMIQHELLAGYDVVLERTSTGRTEEAALTTLAGNDVLAKSSVDMQQSEEVSNTFLSVDGGSQLKVSCITLVKIIRF